MKTTKRQIEELDEALDKMLGKEEWSSQDVVDFSSLVKAKSDLVRAYLDLMDCEDALDPLEIPYRRAD